MDALAASTLTLRPSPQERLLSSCLSPDSLAGDSEDVMHKLLPIGLVLLSINVFVEDSTLAVCAEDGRELKFSTGPNSWLAFAVHASLQLLGWIVLRCMLRGSHTQANFRRAAVMGFHLYAVIVTTIFCLTLSNFT